MTDLADSSGLLESDFSEEQQDWRFLSSNGSLPKRGEKDFEPNGTALQSDALHDSRQAMYAALRGERGHAGKLHITATWHQDLRRAAVAVPKGPHFNTIGKSDSSGTVWLLPEELIYLVERGSIECFYPQGAPMSLQATYAACITSQGDLERLQTYTYLKKLGFIVQRALSYEEDYSLVENSPYKLVPSKRTIHSVLYSYMSASILSAHQWYRTTSFLGVSHAQLSTSPKQIILNKPIYSSYDQIYDDLDIIPFHAPPHSNTLPTPHTTVEPKYPYRVAFNVWKPTAGTFKKSNPPAPDFRVAVVSMRDSRVPTLAQSLALLDSVPVTETEFIAPNNSRKKRALEAAAAAKASGKPSLPRKRDQTWTLKDGWRNVILAVIDAGVISFTKMADSGFGEERVRQGPAPGGKQGTRPNRTRK